MPGDGTHFSENWLTKPRNHMGLQKRACENSDTRQSSVFCKKTCELPGLNGPLQFGREDNKTYPYREPLRSGKRRPKKGLERRVVELEKSAPDRFRLGLTEDLTRSVRGPVLPAAERDSPSPDCTVGPDVQSGIPPRAPRLERPHLDGHRTTEPGGWPRAWATICSTSS